MTTATVTIRDIASDTTHDVAPETRCLTSFGLVTVADLEVGAMAAVESDDDAEGDDHPVDSAGDAARDGHIWWCSERIA